MENNFKHTPGPWEIDPLASAIDGEEDIVIQHEGCPIVTVRGTNDMSCVDDDEELMQANDEVIANAKLIAAAPELLEALINLVEFVKLIDDDGEGKEDWNYLNSGIAAIKKATE